VNFGTSAKVTKNYSSTCAKPPNYYKRIFTNVALERITGINQKQLQHYATGLKKPGPHNLYKAV
jgi:hypothetical protein